MRGFPLVNLLSVAAVLLLLLWPLIRMDRPVGPGSGSDPAPAGAPAGAGIPVMLGLRFVREPLRVELSQGNERVVLRGSGLERQAETRLDPAGRSLELSVEAAWPPGTGSSLIEVKAAPDGLPEQLQNLWGEEDSVSDIIRFTWRAKP